MRAPESRDLAVEVVGHRELFARGLGVKVDENRNRSNILQDLIYDAERIVRREVHRAAADQIRDGDRPGVRLEHAPAVPRKARCKVRRAEDIAAVVKIRADLAAAKRVVAERDDVGPSVEDQVSMARKNPHAIGVFAVDDAEIDLIELFQAAQVAAEIRKAGQTHHVADGQNSKFHENHPCCFLQV